MDIFGCDDWFEGVYQNGRHDKVRLFVARGYDHKRLYHHPELALSYGNNLTRKDILNLPDHPEIPVYILSNDDNSILVAYTLLYDDKFIKDPITHQLGDSIRLLVNARKPLTLFYASQSGLNSNTPPNHSAAVTLLSLAIQNFRSQPR